MELWNHRMFQAQETWTKNKLNTINQFIILAAVHKIKVKTVYLRLLPKAYLLESSQPFLVYNSGLQFVF